LDNDEIIKDLQNAAKGDQREGQYNGWKAETALVEARLEETDLGWDSRLSYEKPMRIPHKYLCNDQEGEADRKIRAIITRQLERKGQGTQTEHCSETGGAAQI